MKYLSVGIGLFIFYLAFALGILALVAWGVSVLVTYLFTIDFGFWKAVAALVLLWVVAGFFRR